MAIFYVMKVSAYNLQEILIGLIIIGVLLSIAVPELFPKITKAKTTEAQLQLKALYNSQTTYRYMYSKYSNSMDEIDFVIPKTVKENGQANYIYEILSANNNSFRARAIAITDFDGDGIFNIWEINEDGVPKQTVKD